MLYSQETSPSGIIRQLDMWLCNLTADGLGSILTGVWHTVEEIGWDPRWTRYPCLRQAITCHQNKQCKQADSVIVDKADI
jgi:hypothetical protein